MSMELNKANECTCPSGDGSLRHPCPAHPVSVEQAGGDERDLQGAQGERDQCAPLNANDELMTVAQHAASVARWAEMFNRVEQERDAALARVAELELKLDQSDYAYDNDRHHMRGMAKQAAEAIQVFTGHDSGANLAHRYGEKWWEHLDELRDALLAFAKNAPVAQAQHSVPEGWRIERSAERIVVMNLKNGAGYAAARDGESGIAESVLYLLAADLLAAAPGKEGV